MSTTTHPVLIAVDLAEIERIHQALMDLAGSASSEGCEEPYAVIDVNHLNALKIAFLPLRRRLDDAPVAQSIPAGEDPAKEVDFVVEAFETSAWGADGDGPEFTTFCVTRKFLTELQNQVQLAATSGFESVNFARSPTDWGPGNIDQDLRLQSPTLVVTAAGDLWFKDRPKYGDYSIQSRAVSLESLREAFEAAAHQDTCFISASGSEDQLAARYWDDECEKALNSLPAGEEPDPASTTPEQMRYARALAAVEALETDDDDGDDITPAAPVSN